MSYSSRPQNNPYAGQNPYSQAPPAGPAYGGHEEHELQSYNQPTGSTALSQQEFLQQIGVVRDDISTLSQNVQDLAGLHQRALSDISADQTSRQLDRITAETSALNRRIRDQLKLLTSDASRTSGDSRGMKVQQLTAAKNNFERELRSYDSQEKTYRERCRDQIARQYRLVRPEASEDEVREAVTADWGTEGVFQAALRSSRTGQATSILGNVRARHNELLHVERTLGELAEMVNDLATMVVQHEVAVDEALDNAENTVKDLERGQVHVEKGIKRARLVRKWKWWLALVIFLILLVIGLAVGITARTWT